MSRTSTCVRDAADLLSVVDAWDALAVATGSPTCAPDWMLGWQRRVLPRSQPVTVLLHDGDELVGVAPFVLDRAGGRDDVRLMAAGLLQRIGLLARPGAERDLAAAVGRHLGEIRPLPDVVAFEGVSIRAGWPRLVREGLRPHASSRRHRTSHQAAPVVTLEGHTFESWMATKSPNFRSEMRRSRRRLERSGGSVRLVTGGSEDVAAIVEALGELHRGRWIPVGHPGVIDGAVERLLLDVASAQADGDRLRLWVVELDGVPVSVQVFLAAGREINYWNGGWDESRADLKPGMLGILAAIEDGIARGDRRLDLGGGAQHYKLRFADTDDPLEWAVVAPLQLRYARTRLELLRQQAKPAARRVFNRMPPGARDRVRRTLRRR